MPLLILKRLRGVYVHSTRDMFAHRKSLGRSSIAQMAFVAHVQVKAPAYKSDLRYRDKTFEHHAQARR